MSVLYYLHMDFTAIIEQVTDTILQVLGNPLLADIALGAFILTIALTGVKRGYWFALWNLFFSVVVMLVVLAFFLPLLTTIVSDFAGPYLAFADMNLSRTMAMFLVVTGVLLLGWIFSGFIYLVFTPIKGKNYSYRDLDPMVIVKVKSYGFSIGLIEAVVYVLLYNVVMQPIATYIPEIFPNPFISTLISTLHPDNSIVLSLLNSLLGDYGSIFQLAS
jgi:MFS family permease